MMPRGRKIDCWRRAVRATGRCPTQPGPEALYFLNLSRWLVEKSVVNATACTIHYTTDN
jgi:hypothetical protein